MQGLSRDLLAAALVRIDAAGFRIVLHVHDEILCEVPEDLGNDPATLKRFSRLMTQRPRWALDLPIATPSSGSELPISPRSCHFRNRDLS